MKKIGIALIAILLCASLLIACTPGQTLDRFFSFFGGSATGGNANSYATSGNVIFVSSGNVATGGNAPVATGGNAASDKLPEFSVAPDGVSNVPVTPVPVPAA